MLMKHVFERELFDFDIQKTTSILLHHHIFYVIFLYVLLEADKSNSKNKTFHWYE